jgi:hyperosmotically inducible protein
MRSIRLVLLAVLVGCVLGQPVANAADRHPDAWITVKTKMALITTQDLGSTGINVDTVDGRVTLHGTVGTSAEKAKAEAVARKIDGVQEVRNLLQVVPASEQKVVRTSDKDIESRVKNALAVDKSLSDSSISVQSVHEGTVLLAGRAATMEDHLRAMSIARGVPGVRGVSSEIQSPDRVADDEIRREESSGGARRSETGMASQAASDAWITSAVKLRLLADSDTPALDVNVDTDDGIVTLFGIVPSEKSKSAAEVDAHKVSGVKKVRNELEVVQRAAQQRVEARDDDLTRKIDAAIDSRPELKQAKIDVQVKNGVARLTGSVADPDLGLQAAMTARSVSGVRSVVNDLRIEG